MSTNVNQNGNGDAKPQVKILDMIRQTAPLAVAELDFVKKKFIDNYNLTHKEKIGELMYHRQLVHLKQVISESDKLKAADPFSIYACFLTAAVNGDSLDPQDEETYLVPIGGKAYLWPQAKSRVKRLRNSGQVKFADQAKLVYEGDVFEVENGRVVRHVEKFANEKIVAGYVRFVIDDKGTDKYFIYRKSDWEAWKKKSQQKAGENWAGGTDGQPLAAFLRTKIIIHACKDKSWASGNKQQTADQFPVEVEDPADVATEEGTATVTGSTEEQSFSPAEAAGPAVATVNYSEEDEGGY